MEVVGGFIDLGTLLPEGEAPSRINSNDQWFEYKKWDYTNSDNNMNSFINLDVEDLVTITQNSEAI